VPNLLQQVITRIVAPPIIDTLETVEIQQNQAQRLSGIVGGEQSFSTLVESAPVGDAR